MLRSISPILQLRWICLFRVPPSLALTLQPIPDVSSLTLSASGTNKTLSGPALPESPAVAGKYPLGPELGDPTCNGDLLGFDVNRYSCLQAWNTIPLSGYDVTFGERFLDDSEVKIPRRYSSRKCLVIPPVWTKCPAVHARYPRLTSAHI